MKNRILSFVLAVVMVFAMIPAVAIGSNAADGLGIKISLSNYTVAPGGTAYVDLYASMDNLAGNDGICNFQVYFTLPEGVTILSGGHTVYHLDNTRTVYPTVNEKDKMIAASADAGDYIATAEQLTAPGGALLATVAFNISDAVAEGTVCDIVVNRVSDFALRSDENGDSKPSDSDLSAANFVGGKITVKTVATGVADANSETLDRYDIPEVNSNGEKIVAIRAWNDFFDSCVQEGTYGTMSVPAAVTEIEGTGFSVVIKEALILKSTVAYDGSIFMGVLGNSRKAGYSPVIYYHKRANGADTMYDALKASLKANTNNFTANIMSAGAIIDGSTVTFYGNIVVDDVKYEDVFVEAVFTVDGEERKFTTKSDNKVYTTLTSESKVMVSTNQEMGAATDTYVEGTYLFGGVINNVPAEVLSTLRVTAYGRTWDANGNLIYVCSDVWTPAA